MVRDDSRGFQALLQVTVAVCEVLAEDPAERIQRSVFAPDELRSAGVFLDLLDGEVKALA